MASLVLSDSSQLTDDGFEKLPDQIMYPYAEPYDLQKHDICGVICAILTWLLILYAEFVVMVVMLLPCPYPVYSAVNMIIFQTFASLAFASHLRAMFTDPVRSSTKRKCDERNDPANGIPRRTGDIQVPEML
uniref:Uncharacterized protein n=1 Tax=Timema shepardi TaxID=629360 RepID=A0A7R9AUM8_TIMSH|nr:unnamed protein product [Timema shepardi]